MNPVNRKTKRNHQNERRFFALFDSAKIYEMKIVVKVTGVKMMSKKSHKKAR